MIGCHSINRRLKAILSVAMPLSSALVFLLLKRLEVGAILSELLWKLWTLGTLVIFIYPLYWVLELAIESRIRVSEITEITLIVRSLVKFLIFMIALGSLLIPIILDTYTSISPLHKMYIDFGSTISCILIVFLYPIGLFNLNFDESKKEYRLELSPFGYISFFMSMRFGLTFITIMRLLYENL